MNSDRNVFLAWDGRTNLKEQKFKNILQNAHFSPQNRPNQVYTTFPENPDMAGVQIAIKHAKIVENSKF